MTSGIDEAAAELQGSLFGEVSPAIDTPGAALARSYPVRITVVGAGDVGVACAIPSWIRQLCYQRALYLVLARPIVLEYKTITGL
jgi:NADH dehydrogenase FAD-containing subunit